MDSAIQNKKIKLEYGVNDRFNNIRIRSLYIAPIKPDLSNKIKEYFERFGEMNSMEMLQKNNTQYGLIEFKMAETAEKVLSTRKHCIENCDIQVEAAEPWHQPDHILNAVDDYCLRVILSNLSLVDLTNSANVCVRFNQQAKTVFSAKHKNMDLTKCSISNAKNAIQTFGPLAHSIHIEGFPPSVTYLASEYGECIRGPENNSEILSTIDLHCTSVLNELKLIEFDFEDTLYGRVILDSAFNTLEKLVFYNCQLTSNVKDLLALCNELKVLEFNKCTWSYEDVCVSKYKKIEELRLVKRIEFNDRTLKRFIILNPSLIKLSFVGLGQRDISVSKTLHTIAENLPNLLELEFQHCTYETDFVKSLPHLGKLTTLKVLKFDLTTVSAKQLCDVLTANGTPIECLRLNFGEIDTDAIKSISQMKNLKILQLCDTGNFTDNNLMQLAKDLGHQLEKLELLSSTAKNLTTIGLKKMLPFATKLSLYSLHSDTITIDLDDYRTMLDAIKKRSENKRLSLQLSGQRGQIRVPKTMLLENCDTLHIKEIVDKTSTDYYSSSSYYSSDSDSYDDQYDYDSNDDYSFGSD